MKKKKEDKPKYCENNSSNMICKALALNTSDYEKERCVKCYYYNNLNKEKAK